MYSVHDYHWRIFCSIKIKSDIRAHIVLLLFVQEEENNIVTKKVYEEW